MNCAQLQEQFLTCGDVIDVVIRWKIHPTLAGKLIFIVFPLIIKYLKRNPKIISGQRSVERQKELAEAGYRTADPTLSTHVAGISTPLGLLATGVDISLGFAPTTVQKLAVGAIVESAGLRWGGGAQRDSRGIPVGHEWAHIDLGRVAPS